MLHRAKNYCMTLLGETFTSAFNDGNTYLISLSVCTCFFYKAGNSFDLKFKLNKPGGGIFYSKKCLFPIIIEATMNNFSCHITDFSRIQSECCHMNFHTNSCIDSLLGQHLLINNSFCCHTSCCTFDSATDSSNEMKTPEIWICCYLFIMFLCFK